jgi:hypothetical protein
MPLVSMAKVQRSPGLTGAAVGAPAPISLDFQ